MKKVIFITIFSVLFFGVNTANAYLTTANGHTWNKLTPLSKKMWITGYMTGLNISFSHSNFYEVESVFDKIVDIFNFNEKEGKEVRMDFYNLIGGAKEENAEKLMPCFCIEDGKYLIEGLDVLYKEKENLKITMVDALYLVKMIIEEKKPELIKAQKKYLLMQPINYHQVKSLKNVNYKNIKSAQKIYLENRIFLEPKTKNPSKASDYNYHFLFLYGNYGQIKYVKDPRCKSKEK